MAWDPKEAAAWYRKLGAPGDQGVLISLLREAQQENGGSIPPVLVEELAVSLGAKPALLLALIRRIPSLRLSDRHLLELCGGPVCSRSAALADYARAHCPANVELRLVPCMRRCGKGPNLRFDGKHYEGADEALLRQLLEGKA